MDRLAIETFFVLADGTVPSLPSGGSARRRSSCGRGPDQWKAASRSGELFYPYQMESGEGRRGLTEVGYASPNPAWGTALA
jgi:hypothetical protein